MNGAPASFACDQFSFAVALCTLPLYTRHLTREELNRILVHHTGQGIDKIQKDTDRDFFMTAEQAKEYRIVDEVISSKPTTRAISEAAALAAQVQK